MQGRQKIKKYNILSLLIVTFILRIDFADAKNGKWKPGIENYRRFPIDRTLQNDGRIPTGKRIQNDKVIQLEEKIQNNRRISNDRILQNGKRIPTGKTIQNDRRLQIDGNTQNDRIIPIDRTFQNDRRIPIDRTLQSDRRFAIDRTLQNDRRILTGQHNSMHIDRKKIKNDSAELEMQYNKRGHSASLTDGIMEEDRRKRINRILKNDRLTKNELQKKIDSLTQNKNIQQDGRRMLNVTMQNDRQTQNDLEVQNATRVLDERNQEMINARRTGYEKRMWAATPHRTARRQAGLGPHRVKIHKPKSKFNASEFILPNYTMPKLLGKEEDAFVSGLVWENLKKSLKQVHDELPYKHSWLISRACHIIATTQISAQLDIRKYFTVRYFYQNNLAYEVGYLVNEIVLKYQRMLELYDLATKYYYKNRARFYAPSTYVLYLYTNVLEMGTVISHLCNMLNEMEAKYRFIPVKQSGFSDYHLEKKGGFLGGGKEGVKGRGERYEVDEKLAAQVRAYEKALAKLKKDKLKQKRKDRAKHLKLDTVVTTPDRRQKPSRFPLEYGWSIEIDW